MKKKFKCYFELTGGNGAKDTRFAVPDKNQIFQVERTEKRPMENHQRKPDGFLDVQNSSLSFVNFQSSRESCNDRSADEQKMLSSKKNYTGGERVAIARSRNYTTQTSRDRLASRGVTVKQLKNAGLESSETFKQLKNGDVSSTYGSYQLRCKSDI